jgi:hypothetical protein
MRQKFIFTVAICLCIALAVGAAIAATRVRDDSADRSRRAEAVQDGPVGSPGSDRSELTTMASNDVRNEFGMAGRSVAAKATGLLATAKPGSPDAINALSRLADMDLPDTPAMDKLRTEVFTRLADHYANRPSRQVRLLGTALQYSADAGQQAEIERRIIALGGDPVAAALNGIGQNVSDRVFGTADTCTAATAVAIPFSTVLTIDPFGDHDWYTFDVTEGSGGAVLRIETMTDQPGSFVDDTDLRLCDGCVDGAGGIIGIGPGFCDVGTSEVAFNDNGVGTNGVFSSRIDTDCLPNGTYYLAVGGFSDSSGADDFTLDIDVTSDCTPPSPDDFEPDGDRANATPIGNTTSLNSGDPDHIKAEIQCHNFFPSPDTDWVKFKLARNELVHIETACDFPTIFNDFTIDCGPDSDTVVRLHYPSDGAHGGLCNQSNIDFGPVCLTDADCPVPLDGPIPGFPPCIEWLFFGAFAFDEEPDSPLARNDDKGGGSFGSELNICLPLTVPRASSPSSSVRTDPSPGEFHWYVRTDPFSGSQTDDYCIQVRNVEPCCFEIEPNDDFPIATPFCLGGADVHGIFEYKQNFPFQDADLWCFDVPEEQIVAFQTQGPSSSAETTFRSDTFLQLFVGPDNNGDFFFTGISDDDGGGGFLSHLDLELMPAAELLGETPPEGCLDRLAFCAASGDDDDDDAVCAPVAAGDDDDDDAGPPLCPAYYLNVTSAFLNPNFPYTLQSTVFSLPDAEVEPNDDCNSNAQAISVGDTIDASLDPTCDFDTYKLSLGSATDVSIALSGGGDSVMELVDCSDSSRITCDDDGGPGLMSAYSGCLPAGDYCVRIRAFSSFATFEYALFATGGSACDPGSEPLPAGDGIFLCDDSPAGEFDTCP